MSKMNELACLIFQKMIDHHKEHPLLRECHGIGDPHGIHISNIERIEDKVEVHIDNDGTKITSFEPQFIVWIWREGGMCSPNPTPEVMTLHELKHKMIECASYCVNSDEFVQFVNENFPEKKERKEKTIVGNVYLFNKQHYVVAAKKGDAFVVVPFDRKVRLVGDYDSFQGNYVYRLKHRVELPYYMFHRFSKEYNWQVDKEPLFYLPEECLQEINDKIKLIEESPDPDNFKDEYCSVENFEEYALIDKFMAKEKDDLLHQVELYRKDV